MPSGPQARANAAAGRFTVDAFAKPGTEVNARPQAPGAITCAIRGAERM